MIKTRSYLCVGCGRCAEGCPQQAISMVNGQARISQALCNHCRICLGLCPTGAIVELEPVSKEGLAVTVDSLKQEADDLIGRIERLRQRNTARGTNNSELQ